MPKSYTSSFLLGQIHSISSALSELHAVDDKRKSDGNMLYGWVTNGTQQHYKWGGGQYQD